MAWKKGPLPKDTWNWGGVVPVSDASGGGFYFADFKGDHAVISTSGEKNGLILKPEEIAFYDNSIELPPTK